MKTSVQNLNAAYLEDKDMIRELPGKVVNEHTVNEYKDTYPGLLPEDVKDVS